MSEDKQGLPKIIDSGVLIVFASAGAYLFTYLFERGYLAAFGIPPEFIEISIKSLVATGGAFLLFSILVFQLFGLLIQIDGAGFFSKENGFGRFVLKWGFFVIMWSFAFVFFKLSWMSIVAFGVWALSLAGDLLGPFFLRGEGQSYNESLADWINDKNDQPKRYVLFKSSFLQVGSLCVMIFALVSFACLFSGQMAAMTRTGFVSFSEAPDYLVLRRYETEYLLVKYDASKGRFHKEFKIVHRDAPLGVLRPVKLPSWKVQFVDE